MSTPSKKYFVLTSKYFKPFILYQGERVSIGRDRQNAIYVPSSTLSRQHSEVFISNDGEAFLTDCNSRNGTYLNGISIQKTVRLHSGDRIKLGGLPIFFEEHVEFSEEENKKDQITSVNEGIKFTSSSTEVMGNLRYMDMLEILTTINYFQKSGVLSLRHGDQRGEIHLREGEIMIASFEALSNVEAVHHMLAMKEGLFVFEPKENISETKEVFLTIQQIMMEYAYHLDKPQEESNQDTFVLEESPENTTTSKQFPPPPSIAPGVSEEPPTSPM